MVGHSENDMIMTHGQCALHQLVNPEGLFGCLTFRTMPVATTVIAITNRAAVVTHLLVPAKSSGSTECNFCKHLLLQGSKLSAVLQRRSKPMNHIGQLKPCSHFLVKLYKESSGLCGLISGH